MLVNIWSAVLWMLVIWFVSIEYFMWLCLKLVWLLFFWFFIWASSESSLGHWVWHIRKCTGIHGMLPFGHASLEFMEICCSCRGFVLVYLFIWVLVESIWKCTRIRGMLPFGHASLEFMAICCSCRDSVLFIYLFGFQLNQFENALEFMACYRLAMPV